MAKQPRILAGQTAAITGGARGIGRATAQAFVRQGMKVAIGDVDLLAAQQTAAELGGSTVALGLDVTERESFSKFLDGVEEQLVRSMCSSTTPGSCRSGASWMRTI
jgi:NAD(P)-dependent dehydrogenase (short-subunit alcohol dehydrogenase family)